MTVTVRARRLLVPPVLSMLALPFLGSAAGAGAAGTEVCRPSPHAPSSFCITYQASIGPNLDARAPFDTDVTFSNTSDSHQTDQAKWIDSVTLHLADSNVAAPGVTQSVDLPNHLVIAGDDADCAEPFTACDAGHGVFVFHVSGSFQGAIDGDYTGTAGILRIVNVNGPGTQPGTFRYEVDIQFCGNVPPFGSCAVSTTRSIGVQGMIPKGSGSVDLTIPVFVSGDQSIGLGPAHYAGTLDSGEIHLNGTANRLDDGSAVGPFSVFMLPARCGVVSGSGAFSTHQNTPRRVQIPQQEAAIGGCPTAAFTPTLHGSSIAFDGRASAARTGHRTVESWRWVFGDGHHVTRTTPAVSHAYPASPASARDYTVSLVVVDSAGAIGSPTTAVIHGSAVALNAPMKSPNLLKLPGKVTPFLGGSPVSVVLQRRSGGTFHAIGTKNLSLNPASSFVAAFPRPAAGMCRSIARFAGDATHLAGSTTKIFSC